jgi:hypothetical protein
VVVSEIWVMGACASCDNNTYAASEPLSDLVVRYRFNGDLTDSSGNSRPLTLATGAVAYSYTIVREGSTAINLDTADKLTVNIGAAINIGVFTIAFWYYSTAVKNDFQALTSTRGSCVGANNGDVCGWVVYIMPSSSDSRIMFMYGTRGVQWKGIYGPTLGV